MEVRKDKGDTLRGGKFYPEGGEFGNSGVVGARIPESTDYADEISDGELRELGEDFAVMYLMVRGMLVKAKGRIAQVGGARAVHDAAQQYVRKGPGACEVAARLKDIFSDLVDPEQLVSSYLMVAFDVVRGFEREEFERLEEEVRAFNEEVDDLLAGLRGVEDKVRAEQGLPAIDWDDDSLPTTAYDDDLPPAA